MAPNRKSRKSYSRRCTSFPFIDLPLDLQLHVLSYLDLQTLSNAVNASSQIDEIYTLYSESVLKGVTNRMGAQVQNLMLTTFSVIQSIRNGCTLPGLEVGRVEKYFAECLDREWPRKILKPEDNTLRAVSNLLSLDSEVAALVQQYAKDTYGRACRYDNPCAIYPRLVLSRIEHHRIARAFWRLKLYGVLFYDYADRFNLDLSQFYSAFLDRIAVFEMDEMVTAYQFMVRYRLHFTSACPHKNCPFKGTPPCRNRDPFECRDCQGCYLLPHLKGRGQFGKGQAFWRIVEDKYLTRLWANHMTCRETPVKIWEDIPESNGPNAGWEECQRAKAEDGLNGEDWVLNFRNLGFCFWDRERLEGWDFFQERWEDYERAGIKY